MVTVCRCFCGIRYRGYHTICNNISNENVKERTMEYKRLGLPEKQVYEVICRIFGIHDIWVLSGLCFLSS
jgi:hypothetical protein